MEFKVVVIDEKKITDIQNFTIGDKSQNITVENFVKTVQIVLKNHNIFISDNDFKVFAYSKEVWIDENESIFKYENENIFVLVGISQINSFGNSIKFFKMIVDLVLREQNMNEEKMIKLLQKLGQSIDIPTEESLIEKLNAIIQLKPSLFGIGIDLNKIIKLFFK